MAALRLCLNSISTLLCYSLSYRSTLAIICAALISEAADLLFALLVFLAATLCTSISCPTFLRTRTSSLSCLYFLLAGQTRPIFLSFQYALPLPASIPFPQPFLTSCLIRLLFY